MIRSAVAAAGLIVLGVGCSGAGVGASVEQADGGDRRAALTYSYPGCERVGFYGCDGLLQVYCAAELIEDRHNACSTASDCASVTVPNCAGVLECPPAAVNTARRGAFEAELIAELEKYCARGCGAGGSCAYSFAGPVACLNGRCVAIAEDARTP